MQNVWRGMLIAMLVGFLFLFSGAWGTAQEVIPTPTIQQCRSDQAVWLTKFQADAAHHRTPSDEKLAKDLYDFSIEMAQCEGVDQQNWSGYADSSCEAYSMLATRMMHFLDRHDLYQKFLSEDRAGKR
jgi:hypothetical protein